MYTERPESVAVAPKQAHCDWVIVSWVAPASSSPARGRDANTATRISGSQKATTNTPSSDNPHVMRRGTSRDPAQVVRGIIAARDEWARIVHQVAAGTGREDLPDRVRSPPTAAPTPFNQATAFGTGTRKPRNLVVACDILDRRPRLQAD